jgi:hypothetical protein
MTPPPSPPRRRRRRIVVAAAVLLVVSFCSWWYCPRGDARFVGKWTVEYANGEKWLQTLTFRPNGVVVAGFATAPGSLWPGRPSVSTVWSIKDSKLRLGIQGVDRWTWLSTVSHKMVEAFSGSSADLVREELEIQTIDSDVIQLLPLNDNDDKGVKITLRRIPE